MAPAAYPALGLLIDGEWIGAAERETLDVHNPATGALLGRLPIATPQDIDRAAHAAQRAFGSWRRMTPLERGRLLSGISSRIRERRDMLASILTMEQGKPLREAQAEIVSTADAFEWMAEEGRRVYGRTVPSRFADVEQLVVHEPVGPVAAFSPWNFPASLAGRKVATALAAGCTIVLKPAEETPGIWVALARICIEGGLPAGALNLLYGVPAQISERLIASRDIGKISFTGSIPVGRHLATLAGAAMKRITLELGGNSPVIVCDDADIERVATLAATSKFRNAGQICNCPTRFFVQQAVFEPFVRKLTALASEIRIGNGLDDATQMGPLVHARRVSAMRELTEDALSHGGELRCGGNTPHALRDGAAPAGFWRPTVITGAGEARAWREEPFGPMAMVDAFTDIEDAIERANDTDYGLASYAFTGSLARAKLIQDRIQAGCFSLNTFAVSPPEMPYGGVKLSGLGREMGSEGLLEHFHIKAVLRAV